MSPTAVAQLYAGMARTYLGVTERWAPAFTPRWREGSVPAAITALAQEIAGDAVRRGIDETDAVLASATEAPSTIAFLARLGDLTRSNLFLSLEAALKVQEMLTRDARLRVREMPGSGVAIWRALAIGSVVGDIATGYLVLRNREQFQPQLVTGQDWDLQHQRGANRFLDMATSLGGALIKAGQFLSSRPDLLPVAYIDALVTLQDQVPPVDWDIVAVVIEQQLGRTLPGVFATFAHESIAAGSLAQVHQASLLDGSEVAVKVQYPDIEDLIGADIMALGAIARLLAGVQSTLQLQSIVAHLRETLPLELDFLREARQMRRLREAFGRRADVYIPEPVDALCTRYLLVMEFVRGIKITDREALIVAGIDPGAVARLLNELYAEQIFRLGILHGDPHPGNILVQPGPRIVLLDHGLTVEVPIALRRALGDMVRALAAGDLEALADALGRAGIPDARSLDVEVLLRVGSILLRGDQPPRDAYIARLSTVLNELPLDLILIGRAFALLHGVTRQLDPTLDVLELVARFVV